MNRRTFAAPAFPENVYREFRPPVSRSFQAGSEASDGREDERVRGTSSRGAFFGGAAAAKITATVNEATMAVTTPTPR